MDLKSNPTKVAHFADEAPLIQFRLRTLFLAMALIALILAPLLAIQRAMYRSPHQRSMDSVNSLDGWAREEADGNVVADLNGGTCPIRDESIRRLIDCQRLRKLTAYKTLLTDAGLQYLHVHKDLQILHLDDCFGITDNSIPELSKLEQLTELSLIGTALSEAGLQTLRTRLPNCSINPRAHGLAKD